jgi:hypothetical protein
VLGVVDSDLLERFAGLGSVSQPQSFPFLPGFRI